MAQEPAVIVARADGTYVDANAPALDLLGVTLDQLRAASPGQFSAEPQDEATNEAFRRQWESVGGPDIGGETTIVTAQGRKRRVRFMITKRDDETFAAALEPIDEPVSGPSQVFTAGAVLSEWRAAERRLEAVPADSPEAQATRAQIAELRDRYQRLFEARRG